MTLQEKNRRPMLSVVWKLVFLGDRIGEGDNVVVNGERVLPAQAMEMVATGGMGTNIEEVQRNQSPISTWKRFMDDGEWEGDTWNMLVP